MPVWMSLRYSFLFWGAIYSWSSFMERPKRAILITTWGIVLDYLFVLCGWFFLLLFFCFCVFVFFLAAPMAHRSSGARDQTFATAVTCTTALIILALNPLSHHKVLDYPLRERILCTLLDQLLLAPVSLKKDPFTFLVRLTWCGRILVVFACLGNSIIPLTLNDKLAG